MSWLIDLIAGVGLGYLKEILIAVGGLIAVFFARRSGKKAGRIEVERETQQKHAHDVGLANEAENAHRNRTEKQRKKAWEKWTVE